MRLPLTPTRFLYRAVDLYGRKLGVVCGASRFTYRSEEHTSELQSQ